MPPPYYQPFSCPWAWNVQLLQRGCIVANSSDCACFRQWPDIIVHNPLCPPGATQIRWGSHVNRNHFRRRAASSNKILCLLLHFISWLFFVQKVFKILCFYSLLWTVALHDEAKLSKQSKEYSLQLSSVLIKLLLKLTKCRVSWHSKCLTLCLVIIVFYTFTNMTLEVSLLVLYDSCALSKLNSLNNVFSQTGLSIRKGHRLKCWLFEDVRFSSVSSKSCAADRGAFRGACLLVHITHLCPCS